MKILLVSDSTLPTLYCGLTAQVPELARDVRSRACWWIPFTEATRRKRQPQRMEGTNNDLSQYIALTSLLSVHVDAGFP
jgi:hypothetical protein